LTRAAVVNNSLICGERPLKPLAETISVFACRNCGATLKYARVFEISARCRDIGGRACKPDWICEACDPATPSDWFKRTHQHRFVNILIL
jgi:hypothetical protein